MASPSGLSQLRRDNKDIEITEVDKSGKIQRQWLHTKDDQLIQVILPKIIK